ncbi:MAG: hypothetical protein K2X08_05095 [Chlamydiales bacterium]|nr:hypothetical protein [Chlamydiales bacterium]
MKIKHDLDFNVKNRGSLRFEALSRMVDLCQFKNLSLQEFECIQPEKQIKRIVEQFQREKILTVKYQKKIDLLRVKIIGMRSVHFSSKKGKKMGGRLSSQLHAAATIQPVESFTSNKVRFIVINCIALAAITYAALTIVTNQSNDFSSVDENFSTPSNRTYLEHESSQADFSCANMAYLNPKHATCSPFPFCGHLRASSYTNPAYLEQQILTPSGEGYVKGEVVIEEEMLRVVNRLTVNGELVLKDSTVVVHEKSKLDATTQNLAKKTAKVFVKKGQKILSTAARLLQGKN